ncbi:MAG: DUF58 domain-containing protein [Phycisphaeraceae bacterium]|nr:DUF58 domain-containing protein [Phycisphaeraceae bacterium]
MEHQSRYLDPHTLAAIGSLELRARLIVEGVMVGRHRSPFRGYSTEFAEHRQYSPGDDLRHLDWKVFARTDKLHLKQYQKETNLRLIILVDASGSMGFGSDIVPGWRKFDLAATLASALAYLSLKNQDRVRLAVFASELMSETGLSNAHDHWRSIVSALESVREFPEPAMTMDAPRRTDLARLFDQVTARLTHRSLVVLISDLFDETDALERGLARMVHRRHDLIVFQTLDHAELTFPYRSPAAFLGCENEGQLNLDPMALRRVYLDLIGAHVKQVEQITRRFHYDYLRLDSSRPLGAALSQFLARRAAVIGKRG